MWRSILILLAGAAGGAAIVHFAGIGRDAPGSTGTDDVVASGAAPGADFVTHNPGSHGSVAEQGVAASGSAISDAYETAAALTDIQTLQSLIAVAAQRPAGWLRDVELKALLERLSEFDPRTAVVLAMSLDLEARWLASLYQGWAVSDPAAALGELSAVEGIGPRRALALSLLDVFGHDEAALSRVASALPEIERMGFRLEAIVAQGIRNPAGAAQAAMSVGDTMGRLYVMAHVMDSLAATDPAAALAIAAELDSEAPVRPVARVLDSWAFSDPDAVFAYLETAEPGDLRGLNDVFRTLAGHDRERLLGFVDQLPPAQRRIALRAALEVLARHEPFAALAEAASLPAGRDQQMLLGTIARSYARQDPAAALAWARSESGVALNNVIRTIALSDPDHALRLALDESMRPTHPSETESDPWARLALTVAAGTGPAAVGYVADQLLGSDVAGAQSAVESMLPVWATRYPDQALDWAATNFDRLDAGAVRSLAFQYAAGDAPQPFEMVARFPTELHAAWLDGAIAGLARHDPAGAARSLIQLSSPERHVETTYIVVDEWARQDPAAAAAWVVELGSGQTQAATFQRVAEIWARDAPDAASRWVLDLPAGAARDSALDGYLLSMAGTGTLDTRVLARYSSDEARQRAVMRAIVEIGIHDPGQASRLIDQHLPDPMTRRMATDEIERRRQSGAESFRGGAGGPR